MILGLDVSTSITGATILDEDEKVVCCKAWDLRNKKKFTDVLDKAQEVSKLISEIAKEHNIQKVYIEEPFMFFNSGGSSAKTMSILQNFNGMVSWLVYKHFGFKREYLTASQARKLCGIKVPRGTKAKEKVLEFVLDNVPNFGIEYTKFGNPRPGELDRADSWVIAKAGLTHWKQKS